ncbi:hypothetical protein ACFYOG_07350 [Streptomyces sp. NPDC007818]|uniref:hypothetical protein n=1 Tax=Streptomyces sp. NPDC007818 TaxID=3364780 RepID=UPI00369CA670
MCALGREGDEGRVATPWTGDDQEWWDWYMTLAHDADIAPAPLLPGPRSATGAVASDREVAEALAAPYALPDEAVAFFGRHGFVRQPLTARTIPDASSRWSNCGRASL